MPYFFHRLCLNQTLHRLHHRFSTDIWPLSVLPREENARHHPPGFWLDSRQWSSTATIEVPDCWQLCPSRLLANNGKYMFADHYRHVYHIIYSSNRSLQHLDLGASGSNLGTFFDLFRSFERHCHLSFCCS